MMQYAGSFCFRAGAFAWGTASTRRVLHGRLENEERVPAVLLYAGCVPMPGCSRVSRLRTKASPPILGVRRFLNASEEAAGDTARSLPPFAR